jgi:hypothetical protein
MSEKSVFFDSADGDVREYSSADMAAVLSGIAKNGVLDGLEVTAAGSSGAVISAGKAIINGYVYILDESKTLAADAGEGRKDKIVLRLDTENKEIVTAFKSDDSDNTDNEISLAVVQVQTGGIVTNVTDLRTFPFHNPILYGTSAPRSTRGIDGDIYIQYES